MTYERYLQDLQRKAAFARRGQKRKAQAKLRNAVNNHLREFVARGPARDAQLDLFG